MTLILLCVLVFMFGFVLLYGAPYLPTLRTQASTGLDLLNLKSGQTVYELGCGDGRVLNLAASKGYKSVGYELNPLMYLIAKIVTFKNRDNVKVVWGNFWQADLSGADGVFVFLLDKYMAKLDEKMKSEARPGVKLSSYAFKIPGKKIVKERHGVYLYQY